MAKSLKPPAGQSARGCALLFALVWIAFTVFHTVGSWRQGMPPAFLLIELPFFAVGIGMLAWVFWPAIVGMRIARPEVAVSSDALRVGEEFTFAYRQLLKRAADLRRVAIEFVFRETAIYRRGTDTVTVTHETPIETFERDGKYFGAGETLSEELALRVPADGMHTLDAPRNKLQWFVKVHVEIAGWPDFKEEYEIPVIPERVG
jgi:hypothetical protein